MGWLRFQKRRWRDTAAARKRRRLETAQQRDRTPSGPQPAPRGDSHDSPPQLTPGLCLYPEDAAEIASCALLGCFSSPPRKIFP